MSEKADEPQLHVLSPTTKATHHHRSLLKRARPMRATFRDCNIFSSPLVVWRRPKTFIMDPFHKGRMSPHYPLKEDVHSGLALAARSSIPSKGAWSHCHSTSTCLVGERWAMLRVLLWMLRLHKAHTQLHSSTSIARATQPLCSLVLCVLAWVPVASRDFSCSEMNKCLSTPGKVPMTDWGNHLRQVQLSEPLSLLGLFAHR